MYTNFLEISEYYDLIQRMDKKVDSEKTRVFLAKVVNRSMYKRYNYYNTNFLH